MSFISKLFSSLLTIIVTQSMSLLTCCQQQNPCTKRKLDDYAPGTHADSSISVRMRTDVNDTVLTPENHYQEVNSLVSSARCFTKFLKSNSSVQFFVRLLSGMKTLVIRADVNDRVESIHEVIQLRTGIPVNEQRLIYKSKPLYWDQTLGECCIVKDCVLQLVGVMRSTNYPKAMQIVDDMISIICKLCKGKSEDENQDSKARERIKYKFVEYLDIIPQNDTDKAAGHLQVFLSCGGPAALAMLYMSDDNNKICGDELIKQLIIWISLRPHCLQSPCAPILIEICKSLRGREFYEDGIYSMCRACLANMVGYIKLARDSNGGGSTNYVLTIRDMLVFVGEACVKIGCNINAGIKQDTMMGPSRPFLSDVLDFKKFMIPVIRFIKEEVASRSRNSLPSKNGPFDFSRYREELKYIRSNFFALLAKMDFCLKQMEVLLPLKSESLGCYQYLALLVELNTISKLFPDAGEHFRTILRNRKLSFCYLIIKYARRCDDHGWIYEHKEVTNFECRRHLAMLLLPEIWDDYDDLLEMLIERSQLLEESFEYIAHAEADTLRAGLFLQFKNEEATGPGVLREWFVLVCQAIFDPQNALFVACPNDRRRFFPNPASKLDPLNLEYFKFAGRVIALALSHKVQIGIIFDRVLFLQLAGKNVSLEDIQDADPFLYSSCKKILEMDPEIVDQDALALTFTAEIDELGSRNVVELCPDGKNITVNSKNRRNYVDLLIRYRFVKSVAEQVAHFTQGFDDIINSVRLRQSFFQCLELEDLDGILHGSEKAICVEDWKAHTEYHGYKETDPQISWFWKTVGELTAGQRKVLLFFWTSLKYLPVEGFGGLTSRLLIYKSDEKCDRLPSSHTCFYQLCFPPYHSLKVMQDRLRVITQEHVGCSFGTC